MRSKLGFNSEIRGQETATFHSAKGTATHLFCDCIWLCCSRWKQRHISWKSKVPNYKLIIIFHTNTVLQCPETWRRPGCSSCWVHPQVEIVLIPEILAVHKIPDVLSILLPELAVVKGVKNAFPGQGHLIQDEAAQIPIQPGSFLTPLTSNQPRWSSQTSCAQEVFILCSSSLTGWNQSRNPVQDDGMGASAPSLCQILIY